MVYGTRSKHLAECGGAAINLRHIPYSYGENMKETTMYLAIMTMVSNEMKNYSILVIIRFICSLGYENVKATANLFRRFKN